MNGNDNTINLKDGNDNLVLNGDNNTVTATTGTKNIKITGDNNNYTGSSDSNVVTVDGSSNIITGGNSADIITVHSGSDNTVNSANGNDIITVQSAIINVIKRPDITLEKTSLPKLSHPNICCTDGAAFFKAAFIFVGLYGVQNRLIKEIISNGLSKLRNIFFILNRRYR